MLNLTIEGLMWKKYNFCVFFFVVGVIGFCFNWGWELSLYLGFEFR